MARATLHLVNESKIPFGSLRESIAISAIRKTQRIDLLKTISIVTASVNPEKAQDALRNLIEEMYPEVKDDRKKSVERALSIMEGESKKGYLVRALDEMKQTGLVHKINKALKK